MHFCLLPYWFEQWVKTVHSSILLDNLISPPPLSHFHFLLWFSFSLFHRSASLSSLIHTQAFKNKSEEQLQCLWRKESHLEGWRRDKNGRERLRENERQNGGEIRGKTERGREAEKLALWYCMTNKGTALHHCRTLLEKKRSVEW